MKNFLKTLFLLLTTGLISSGAQAHRPWLLPTSTVLEGKEPWVTIDAAISENLFDFDTRAMSLDGLSVTGPDGARVNLEYQSIGRLRSSIDLKLTQPGTYKIALVNEGATASYKLNGEVKRLRGTAASLAKELPANAEELKVTHTHNRQETFVTSGKPNEVALKTSGVGLELVFISHPNELLANEKISLKFLINGLPAANLAFSIVPGGVRYRGVLNEVRLATNSAGEATFTTPHAGMYWINASYPPTLPANAVAAVTSQPEQRASYNATVEVLPQ